MNYTTDFTLELRRPIKKANKSLAKVGGGRVASKVGKVAPSCP